MTPASCLYSLVVGFHLLKNSNFICEVLGKCGTTAANFCSLANSLPRRRTAEKAVKCRRLGGHTKFSRHQGKKSRKIQWETRLGRITAPFEEATVWSVYRSSFLRLRAGLPERDIFYVERDCLRVSALATATVSKILSTFRAPILASFWVPWRRDSREYEQPAPWRPGTQNRKKTKPFFPNRGYSPWLVSCQPQ